MSLGVVQKLFIAPEVPKQKAGWCCPDVLLLAMAGRRLNIGSDEPVGLFSEAPKLKVIAGGLVLGLSASEALSLITKYMSPPT